MGVRLNIVSDLHDPRTVDFSKFNYDVDYIVVAGDSDECLQLLYEESRRRNPHVSIISTSGNHDIFTRRRLTDNTFIVYSGQPNGNLITENGCYRYCDHENGIVFLTAPLFSLVPTDSKLCKKLGDYKEFIKTFPNLTENMSILNFNHLWNCKFIHDLEYLETWVKDIRKDKTIKDYKIIIVTHGIPSFKLIENSIMYGHYLNIYWASDKCLFENIFPECSLWIHGHSHEFCDMIIDNTRCIRNPLRDYNMNIIPDAYSYTIEV